ncbi:MAG: DUF4214 domain-containing protein [Fulvimarina manganoxydans]|uniref:DUF4214 domain-containing protein n=1 Tax=Fulvimarina manganoxydans TaxID=937218 RepID=UPI002356FF72|nr:DUF4214 domain-containing protein [Fulvimarina manganoxydans]MCK5934512.1 DUF4214 domain-containing protein [Fulvimarina manganoxydans]
MDEQFVIDLYQRLALRAPTQTEIDAGLTAIEDRGQDAYASEIGQTEEVVEIQTVVLPIIGLYQAFLERTPEPAGLEFWTNAIQSGDLTFGDLIESFATTDEFAVVNPGIGANPTNEDLVNLFYTNILGRVPDAEGQAFWLNALQTGSIQAGSFTSTFIGSTEVQDDIGASLRAYYADVKDGQIDDPANSDSLRGDDSGDGGDVTDGDSGDGGDGGDVTDGGAGDGGGALRPVVTFDEATGTITLTDNTNVAVTLSDGSLIFTDQATGRDVAFDREAIGRIDLNRAALDISGDAVDALFPDANAGTLDIVGFSDNDGARMNISGVDFGNIKQEKLQSPNVWLSDQDADSPIFAGFTFSELEDSKSILPDGLTVNGNVEDAFKAWWDSFDDFYASGTNYYNDFINERFVFIGNDYAEYLLGGGEAYLDIAKTGGDYTARQQTLHDNLLGNLIDSAVADRFPGDDDPRTASGAEFGDRPYVSGNDNSLVRFEEAKDWDSDHSISRNDSDKEVLLGRLSDIAVDGGKQMWVGSGNTVDQFRIVRDVDQEIELALKAKIRGGADYLANDRTDLLNDSYYEDIQTDRGSSPSWNDAGRGAEATAKWSFDFSVATNIDQANGFAPSLSDYVVKLKFDVDPGLAASFVTLRLDQEDASIWRLESADNASVEAAASALVAAREEAGADGYISDNEGRADTGTQFVAQNSQNYGFANSMERLVNTFLENAYEADGTKSNGVDYWEAEADPADFFIGLEAYGADGVTLLAQNYIAVDSIVGLT